MANPPAVLTEFEANRVRHHTGYLLTLTASSIQLGVPHATQPQFLLEMALQNLSLQAAEQIRQDVIILDNLELKLIDAQDRMAASKVGSIDLNASEVDMLWKEYYRWADVLACDLGIPLNAYANRFRAFQGNINISVSN